MLINTLYNCGFALKIMISGKSVSLITELSEVMIDVVITLTQRGGYSVWAVLFVCLLDCLAGCSFFCKVVCLFVCQVFCFSVNFFYFSVMFYFFLSGFLFFSKLFFCLNVCLSASINYALIRNQ